MEQVTRIDTSQQKIKITASNYINLFVNVGVSFDKSKKCAVIMVNQLKQNYDKNFVIDHDNKAKSEMEWEFSMKSYDRLIAAIQAY